MNYFLQGLLLGFAYVAPIGVQNLFVINYALKNNLFNSVKIAFITIFFDISLALSCFFASSFLINNSQFFQNIFPLLGSFALLIIGIKMIKTSSQNISQMPTETHILKIILICFSVTWLNPQAIIDGSLLFGGIKSTLPPQNSTFILGVSLASFLWFTLLASLTSIFHHIFNPKILRIINLICGLIILFFAAKLFLNFLR